MSIRLSGSIELVALLMAMAALFLTALKRPAAGEPLNRGTTDSLKGFSMLVVLCHHIALFLDAPRGGTVSRGISSHRLFGGGGLSVCLGLWPGMSASGQAGLSAPVSAEAALSVVRLCGGGLCLRSAQRALLGEALRCGGGPFECASAARCRRQLPLVPERHPLVLSRILRFQLPLSEPGVCARVPGGPAGRLRSDLHRNETWQLALQHHRLLFHGRSVWHAQAVRWQKRPAGAAALWADDVQLSVAGRHVAAIPHSARLFDGYAGLPELLQV